MKLSVENMALQFWALYFSVFSAVFRCKPTIACCYLGLREDVEVTKENGAF